MVIIFVEYARLDKIMSDATNMPRHVQRTKQNFIKRARDITVFKIIPKFKFLVNHRFSALKNFLFRREVIIETSSFIYHPQPTQSHKIDQSRFRSVPGKCPRSTIPPIKFQASCGANSAWQPARRRWRTRLPKESGTTRGQIGRWNDESPLCSYAKFN